MKEFIEKIAFTKSASGKETVSRTAVEKLEESQWNLNKSFKNRIGEYMIEKLIFVLGITALLIMGLIFVFLIRTGFRLFEDVTLGQFLMGREWYPNATNPRFGILPMIAGTTMVTVGAILISVPIGIGSAIFIAEVAPPKTKTVFKVIIEFLSAIPSVVLGFLGIVVLSNWVRISFNLSSGFTVLTGSIMISLMALPTIISVADDAIRALPDEYREASLALGASKWETIKNVLLPAASSGIIAAVMLGVGRAIGETMAVMMVMGNAVQIPSSFLVSGRTMTATIAAEMGDTVRNGTHYNALFAIGVVLLLMTSIINIISEFVLHRAQKEGR